MILAVRSIGLRAYRAQAVSSGCLKNLLHVLRALFDICFVGKGGSGAGRIRLHRAQDTRGLRQALASDFRVRVYHHFGVRKFTGCALGSDFFHKSSRVDVGGCQNNGPFWVPIIIRHLLTTHVGVDAQARGCNARIPGSFRNAPPVSGLSQRRRLSGSLWEVLGLSWKPRAPQSPKPCTYIVNPRKFGTWL